MISKTADKALSAALMDEPISSLRAATNSFFRMVSTFSTSFTTTSGSLAVTFFDCFLVLVLAFTGTSLSDGCFAALANVTTFVVVPRTGRRDPTPLTADDADDDAG